MNQGIYGLTRADGRDPSRPLATLAQAQDFADASAVLSASRARDSVLAVCQDPLGWATTAASGGSHNSTGLSRWNISGATANGTASYFITTGGGGISPMWSGGGTAVGAFPWNRRRWLFARVARAAGGTANSVYQFGFSTNNNAYSAAHFEPVLLCEIRNNRFWLVVRNAATTTSVDSGVDYSSGAVDVLIESDGAGNASLSVDGVRIATATGAPTATTTNSPTIRFSVTNGGDTTSTAWGFGKSFWSYA